MLKTNMLKKIKKCGVLLLALVISAAAVLPAAGSAAAAGNKKMLCFENSNVQSGVGVKVRVENGVSYKISFKYKLESGSFVNNNGAGVAMRLYNGDFTSVVDSNYTSGKTIYTNSVENGYCVYTATVNTNIGNYAAGQVYPMIFANSGGNRSAKIYIAGITVYKADDALKTNLLSDGVANLTDLSGWYFKDNVSGSGYTKGVVLDGNLTDGVFETAESKVTVSDYDDSNFISNMITIKNTSGTNGIAVKAGMTAGKTYKVTFNYNLLGGSQFADSNGSGITVRMYTDYKMNVLGAANYSENCGYTALDISGWKVYTAALTPSVDCANGRLAIILNGGASEQQIAISDLKMCEEGSETNLLSIDPCATSLNGYYCKATQGSIGDKTEFTNGGLTVTRSQRNDWDFQADANGDINRDGNVDIIDLVALKKMIAKGDRYRFADTYKDDEVDASDLKVERELLLGKYNEADLPVNPGN